MAEGIGGTQRALDRLGIEEPLFTALDRLAYEQLREEGERRERDEDERIEWDEQYQRVVKLLRGTRIEAMKKQVLIEDLTKLATRDGWSEQQLDEHIDSLDLPGRKRQRRKRKQSEG